MILKKLCAAALACGILFGAQGLTQAMPRKELAKIQVNAQGTDFKYWNQNAEPLKKLKDYVKLVTDSKNAAYIPQEERIAVFDMDGTFFGERTPSYVEFMLYIHRTLEDASFTPSEEDRETAEAIRRAAFTGQHLTAATEAREALQQHAFESMTLEEFNAYTENFLASASVPGLTNIKYGELFYLPMLEVISYLNANDFTVYVISGSDRMLIREIGKGVLPMGPERYIGSDVDILASGQGETAAGRYTLTAEDTLHRGKILPLDVMMMKVQNIVRQIGRQPVLAFGNSGGDAAMLNYTLANRQHKGMAFALLCDDTEREYGSPEAAAKMKVACEANGWTAVSMRDDFKTIYGDDVKRTDEGAKTQE